MEGPSTDFREMFSAPVPHAGAVGSRHFPILGCSLRDSLPITNIRPRDAHFRPSLVDSNDGVLEGALDLAKRVVRSVATS